MRNFVWGVVAGALAMWLWLNGLEPIVDAAASLWTRMSSRPAASDR